MFSQERKTDVVSIVYLYIHTVTLLNALSGKALKGNKTIAIMISTSISLNKTKREREHGAAQKETEDKEKFPCQYFALIPIRHTKVYIGQTINEKLMQSHTISKAT